MSEIDFVLIVLGAIAGMLWTISNKLTDIRDYLRRITEQLP